MTRLENNTKTEKPKQLRRKTVADSFIAPLLDTKNAQHPANKGMKRCDFISLRTCAFVKTQGPSEILLL